MTKRAAFGGGVKHSRAFAGGGGSRGPFGGAGGGGGRGPFGAGGGGRGKKKNKGKKNKGRRGGGGGGSSTKVQHTRDALQVLELLHRRDVDAACRAFLQRPSACATALPEILAKILQLGDAYSASNVAKAAQGLAQVSHAQILDLVLSMPQGPDPEDCAYLVEALARCAAWPSLDHQEYFASRMGQIVLEFTEEAKGSIACIRDNDPAMAVRQGKCMYNITLSPGLKHGEFQVNGKFDFNEENRGLQAGDAVALTALDGLRGMVCECEVLVARPLVIKPVEPNHPVVKQRSLQYRVDKLANRTSYSRMAKAVHLLSEPDRACEKSSRKSGRLKNQDKPTRWVQRTIVVASQPAHDARMPAGGRGSVPKTVEQGLNASQVKALQSAAHDSVALVQGPPGTGKTATAVRILQMWVQTSRDILSNRKAALLATSDSNIAVDNLVEGLARAGLKVVRLGRPEMAKPELLRYCADEIAAKACGVTRLSELRDAQKKRGRDEIHRAIEEAEVVCCTAMGAGSGMLTDFSFPKVLMDESSQATEPASIVPTCKGCRQMVLIGDHCQLPPTVSSDLATKAGMTLSLFERLADAGVRTAMLQIQYRMHPIISAFPASHFYAGELSDGIDGQDRMPPRGFAWPSPSEPLAVVPVAGWERKEGTSWENEAEAAVVVNTAQKFLAGGLEMADLGVCTPYGAQARLIRRLLQRSGIKTGRDFGGVEVNSVDSFQGREKEVILLSTVRASSSGGVGFTGDWRRANVAFTRARRGLVVMCNPQTLSREDRTWAPWLRWVAEKRLCVGNMPALPRPSPSTPAVGLGMTRRLPSPNRGARGRSPSPPRIQARPTTTMNPACRPAEHSVRPRPTMASRLLNGPLQARSRSRSRSRGDRKSSKRSPSPEGDGESDASSSDGECDENSNDSDRPDDFRF